MSAVKFALRRGWRKERDNRRIVRVYVPPDEWPSHPAVGSQGGAEAGPLFDTGAAQPIEPVRAQADEARIAERAMWREQLIRERERADKLERERDQLVIMVNGLENCIAGTEVRAGAAAEDRRAAEARAEAAVSRALAAEGDRAAAEARADAERARADVLDQAVARQRSRADRLEQQLQGTEAALVANRARADALAERLCAISRLLAGRSPAASARD